LSKKFFFLKITYLFFDRRFDKFLAAIAPVWWTRLQKYSRLPVQFIHDKLQNICVDLNQISGDSWRIPKKICLNSNQFSAFCRFTYNFTLIIWKFRNLSTHSTKVCVTATQTLCLKTVTGILCCQNTNVCVR
jgi:hypothetical protein